MTQDIFLECAFFTPQSIAGKARRFGLHTDSSHRFERGVDPYLQERAIERATQLITEIAGGSVGLISEAVFEAHLPESLPIVLRRQRIERLLGLLPSDEQITGIFRRLGMGIESTADGWRVVPPGFRFDVTIEADLIEEIARIYGYNNLPSNHLLVRTELHKATESVLELDRARDLLVDRGYQEAITFSFVDAETQLAMAASSASCGCDLTMTDCTISNNEGTGVGLYEGSGGGTTLTDCIVERNSGRWPANC